MDRVMAPHRVEDGSGDAIGQRRLADPLRTADEPGMVNLPCRNPSMKALSPSLWPKKANCSRG